MRIGPMPSVPRSPALKAMPMPSAIAHSASLQTPFKRRQAVTLTGEAMRKQFQSIKDGYSRIPTTELSDDDPEDSFDEEEGLPEPSTWAAVVLSTPFQAVMALLIFSNSVVIGMETDNPEFQYWDLIENLFLAAFTIELFVRMAVLRGFFFSANNPDVYWNMFDLVVVGLGIVDVSRGFFDSGSSKGSVATLFRVVRLLRILRIFRIVRFLKQLYLLAYGLAEAAQAVFWVTILMAFVLYVCSILLVRFVGHLGDDDPHGGFLHSRFGTIMSAMLSLFELMAAPNLPDYQQGTLLFDRPVLSLFLISFVIFGSFGMIALLTGVISESMFEKNQLRMEEERLEREAQRREIRMKCDHMFCKLPLTADMRAKREDVESLTAKVEKMFEAACVEYSVDDIARVIKLKLDAEEKISRDDFREGICALAVGVKSISLQELYSAVRKVEAQLLYLNAAFLEQRSGEPADTGSCTSGKSSDGDSDEDEKHQRMDDQVDELKAATTPVLGKSMDDQVDELKAATTPVLGGLEDLTVEVGRLRTEQTAELQRVSEALRALERVLVEESSAKTAKSAALRLDELRRACELAAAGERGPEERAFVSPERSPEIPRPVWGSRDLRLAAKPAADQMAPLHLPHARVAGSSGGLHDGRETHHFESDGARCRPTAVPGGAQAALERVAAAATARAAEATAELVLEAESLFKGVVEQVHESFVNDQAGAPPFPRRADAPATRRSAAG